MIRVTRLLTVVLIVGSAYVAQAAQYDVKIQYGDKLTEFEVILKKTDGTLKGAEGSVPLNQENTDYLRTQFQRLLSQKSNDLRYCARNSISVIERESAKNTVACIHSSTPAARAASQLADLLSLTYLAWKQ